MRGMQINYNLADESPCKQAIDLTSAEMVTMFDISTYENQSSFDPFDFLDKLSIMTVYLTDQQEKCGFDKYMERMDNMMSHWDAFGGAMAAGVTDIIVSYTDTSRVDDNFE